MDEMVQPFRMSDKNPGINVLWFEEGAGGRGRPGNTWMKYCRPSCNYIL